MSAELVGVFIGRQGRFGPAKWLYPVFVHFPYSDELADGRGVLAFPPAAKKASAILFIMVELRQ